MRAVAWCVALSALVLAGCEEEAVPEIPVRPVISMVIGDVERLRADIYPGRAKATQEVNLSFRVAGPLISFPAKVGDEVEKGDLLAQIDPRDFEVTLRSVEGQLARAMSELEALRIARPEDIARAEAKVSSAKADAKLAGQNLKRLQDIQAEDPGAIAQSMVDQAVAKKQAADAALTNARKEMQIAEKGARAEDIAAKESEIASLQASVDAARDEVDYIDLKAPFHGTIVATYVENFEDVRAKEPILRLLDTSQIEMEVNVPEALIGLAPYVTEILVRFKTLPNVEIPAKIKEISNEASLTTRTYPVTIVMDQPESAEIKPGMAGEATAIVELPGDWAQQGIEVPVSALFSPDDAAAEQIFVWVVNEADSVVAQRQVEVVATANRGVLINGVEAGERIVTAGVSFLSDGQKIRILPE